MKEKLRSDLKQIVDDKRVFTTVEDRLCYSYDATNISYMPEAVVLPITTQEVVDVVKYAHKNKIPLVSRGTGSGYTGGSLPIKGGIVMSMEQMDKILEINQDKKYVVVEPGVITLDLKNEVAKNGLLYAPDPSSDKMSTLGGNVAENAGGLKGRKYGVTRNYVLGLEFVLPDGELVRTGIFDPDEKGYDLESLLIGSEGTLGIITKIALRLLPQPSYDETILASFDDMENAARVVSEITAAGIIPSTMEFIDTDTLDCVLEYMQTDLVSKGGPVLLIEVDGENKEKVHPEMEKIEKICQKNKVTSLKFADTKADKENLWKVRKSCSAALLRVAPTKVNEDVCVPPSQLPALVSGIKKLSEKYKIPIDTFGHAGDGNLHVNIMADRKNPEKMERAEKAVEELFDMTLKLGGTLSGEHGIGITKAKFLENEVGKTGIDVMKRVKKAFDPDAILNPGKIFS
ncbi:MAG: FAD-linked oxidase C-terminal domain-containing protein [Candidatus Zixiibacteriota bacterium]